MQIIKSESTNYVRENQIKRYQAYLEKVEKLKEDKRKEKYE